MASSTSEKSARSLRVKDLDAPKTGRKKATHKRTGGKTKTATQPAKKKVAPKKPTAKKASKAASKTTTRTARSSKTPTKKRTSKKPADKKGNSTVDTVQSATNLKNLLKRNPLGHLLIESKLREAGFRGGVSTDKELLDAYSTDESIFAIRPQVVLQPKDQKDVAVAVSLIAEYSERFTAVSLTPRAAGTGLSGGSLTDSIVIDVCAHMQTIEPITKTKDSLTITCEPGAMLRDVEKALKKASHYLPPYPASKDICSIGGCVANNAAGPDSLRYGHFKDWIESLDVVLYDGAAYTVTPLTYKQLQKLTKKDHALATITKQIFTLIEQNEKEIDRMRPQTKKNSAGYNLWDVLDTSVKEFKKGNGTFDLTQLIAGSQGTIGVVTKITMRAEPIQENTTLIAVPVFDLADASSIVSNALTHNPINVEIFDGLSFDLALKNPDFFKERLSGLTYYQVMLKMYATYHIRYGRKIPDFTLLITLNNEELKKQPSDIVTEIKGSTKVKPRLITNQIEHEMFWQIRRASYSLSKFMDETKRPAAFLEDMTVPPKNLGKFFTEIKALLKKFNVTAAVHGHGGNGHFHFYPLLDFTNQTTVKLVEKMADEFFNTAIKHGGNICGEHNDGIIRTPHLSKMFSKKQLDLFAQTEHIFDPHDLFNPGKKVNPRFNIKDTLRTTN